MGFISISITLSALISSIFLHLSLQHCFNVAAASAPLITTSREALEIIIGGVSYDPSPSPEPTEECPPPPPEPLCPSLPPPTPPPTPSPRPPPPPPSPPPPQKRPFPRPRPRPPPSPLRNPSPHQSIQFESPRIKLAYNAIQKFKKKVVIDPKGVTKSWNTTNVCGHPGFFCANHPEYKVIAVAGVDFNGFQFGGPELFLDGFIDGLEDITGFHANSNNFIGEVPQKIGKLKYLYELDLSNNKLTGPIPRSFARLAKIELLNFGNNKLLGAIPEEVCKLPNSEKVSLANNSFTQVGPACRKLIERKRLDVRSNSILDLPNQKSKAECGPYIESV